MARSSRLMMQRLNAPPRSISSCVNASFSTPMPTSFGSELTCVAQLSVIRFRRSSWALPTTYRPLGIVHRTRRRSRSYSSRCSSVSTPGGNGPTGPSLGGMGGTLWERPRHRFRPPAWLLVLVTFVGQPIVDFGRVAMGPRRASVHPLGGTLFGRQLILTSGSLAGPIGLASLVLATLPHHPTLSLPVRRSDEAPP